jgi:dihydroorotase
MRRFLVSLGLLSSLAGQTPYELVLKGGHVIDPKNGIDRVMDVAISGGKIARVAPNLSGTRVIDVGGLYVTPGLIDLHAHVLIRPRAPSEGIQPDAFSFRSGVTTFVDAGSAGWREFPEVRDTVIRRAKTRVLALLNIAGAGMLTGKEDDLAEMDPDAAVRMARANPDLIVGFKSAHYAGPGWESIDAAVKAGNATGLLVMVDFGTTNEKRNIGTLFLDKLRPGDIYTHCFSGHREELLPNGKLNPAMAAGRKRGIIFDVGHGAGSFFWNVAVPAYAERFYPDSISTDLHINSMNAGMKDLLNVASKMLNLGSPLPEVIRMATWNPARQIRRPALGNLDPGAEADIAVLRLQRGEFGFVDSAGARFDGDRKLVCELTLRAGRVAWDLNGRASRHWKSFPYKKKTAP